MRHTRHALLAAVSLVFFATPDAGAGPLVRPLSDATHITMRHIRLFQFDDAASSIAFLEGQLVATHPRKIIDLNDVTSFDIQIGAARVVVPAATMAASINRHVLPAAGIGISDLHVGFSGNSILLDGKVRKAGLPIGFRATAAPEVTGDGKLRLRIVHLKAAGLFSKKFLDGIGLGMPALFKSRDPEVLRIDRDTMTIPVRAMFPPPILDGRLSGVRVTGAGLVATIGHDGPSERATSILPPTITLSGGTIRFAHIVMPDAKLEIRPTRKEAEFPFSPAHYYAQMLEGYSRATPTYGLIGYFADFRPH